MTNTESTCAQNPEYCSEHRYANALTVKTTNSDRYVASKIKPVFLNLVKISQFRCKLIFCFIVSSY